MISIKLEDCVHGGLYRIHSRNLTFGVFVLDSKGFVGIREKFGHKYLFTEFHYDTGPPFGTVNPQEFLEQCPLDDLRAHIGNYDSNEDLFKWLEGKEKQYELDG